jgi:hypothetical protein
MEKSENAMRRVPTRYRAKRSSSSSFGRASSWWSPPAALATKIDYRHRSAIKSPSAREVLVQVWLVKANPLDHLAEYFFEQFFQRRP